MSLNCYQCLLLSFSPSVSVNIKPDVSLRRHEESTHAIWTERQLSEMAREACKRDWLPYRCTLPLHGSLMSLIHEISFFPPHQQSTPPSGVCTEQTSGCREEWRKQYTSTCLSAQITLLLDCNRREDQYFLGMSPTKATHSADNVAEIWLIASVAHAVYCWKQLQTVLVGLLSTSLPGICEACSHLLSPSMCLLRWRKLCN